MKKQLTASKNMQSLLVSGYNHYSRKDERAFFHVLLTEDTHVAMELLKSEYSGHSVTEDFILNKNPLRNIKTGLICLVTIICRFAADFGADDYKCYALSDSYINEIEEQVTLKNYTEYYNDIINQYRKLVKESRKNRYSATVNQAIKIIRQNLYSHINVQETAEKTGVHPNYLSKKFKDETGEKISDYINRTKAEEAERLLTYTDMTITEISEALCFSSTSHLARVFKKYYSCSPKDIRK